MKIIKKYLSENSLCFDVGANMGKKTDQLLELGARVLCIEPQEDCCELLKVKFEFNPKVTIINKSLGALNGIGKLYRASENTISSMSEDFISVGKSARFLGYTWDSIPIECEMITLDDLIKEYGVPEFCKIDVEGYELEVLKGLNTALPLISIEFTPELKGNSFNCIHKMDSMGLYEYNYSSQETGELYFNDWKSSIEIIDFLNQINSIREFGDIYIKKK